MKTFGQMARQAREDMDLTRKAVAAMCGVEDTTIKNIEQGTTRSASLYTTLRLCAALGIRLEDAAAACLFENLPPKLPQEVPVRARERLQAMAKSVQLPRGWLEP